MSTIDNPKVIANLLKRKGYDKSSGTEITTPDGVSKTILPSARHDTDTIWEYTSGFGTKCWKLIYGMYANSSLTEEEASIIFLATGNILLGSECRAILFQGELTELGKEHLAKFG